MRRSFIPEPALSPDDVMVPTVLMTSAMKMMARCDHLMATKDDVRNNLKREGMRLVNNYQIVLMWGLGSVLNVHSCLQMVVSLNLHVHVQFSITYAKIFIPTRDWITSLHLHVSPDCYLQITDTVINRYPVKN